MSGSPLSSSVVRRDETGPTGLVAVPDALRAAAYDALPAPRRGWIKATLALVEAVHGWRPEDVFSRETRADYGLIRTCRARPADWTLCVPGAGFASAPRLAAAIMCARLTGMENLLTVWPTADASACPPALLTVLELTGVERAFTLPCSEPTAGFWRELAGALREEYGSEGRIMYFGARDAAFTALADMAESLGVPLWAERPPRLAVDPAAEVDTDSIRWAHPDVTPEEQVRKTSCTALYTSAADARFLDRPMDAALLLGPGLEGCWLHPDLSPDFFLTRSVAITRLEG